MNKKQLLKILNEIKTQKKEIEICKKHYNQVDIKRIDAILCEFDAIEKKLNKSYKEQYRFMLRSFLYFYQKSYDLHDLEQQGLVLDIVDHFLRRKDMILKELKR